MDGKRFDAWTKALTGVASRRRVLRGAAGTLLGGAGAVLGRQAAAAAVCPGGKRSYGSVCTSNTQCQTGFCLKSEDGNNRCLCRDLRQQPCGGVCGTCGEDCSDDPGVLFFEKLAARMKRAMGDCAALKRIAAEFRQEHAAELRQLANREQQWSAEERARVAAKNQERITRATETLHTLMVSCRFRGTPEPSICAAPRGDQAMLPGAAQCGAGCDCGCICPISGWDCAGAFFGCVGGSEASCCWFGACAGNICDEQCPNCCNCGVSCCGC